MDSTNQFEIIMEKVKLLDIIKKVELFFEDKLYDLACVKRYRNTWKNLQTYMEVQNVQYYSSVVGKSFLLSRHGTLDFASLTHRQQEVVRHIEVLDAVHETEDIHQNRHKNKVIEFKGELGAAFNSFITEYQPQRSPSTIARYKERIQNLYHFLQKKNLALSDFGVKEGIEYAAWLDQNKASCDRDNIVMTTRVFLRFLCDKKLLDINLSETWMNLFHVKNIRQKKIPSVYTKEEVERTISVIDRNSPHGKRDYAMVLLAARYGLRASDIIGLRFCNLDWESNLITVIQQKTSKKVSLPLSEEVGNAIIEYIKHGRPSIDSPFVFLKARAPYGPLGSNILNGVVGEYMRLAGIDTRGKKSGPHSLRHSLATNLLKNNEPLPVISEILGHSSTESTNTYLRVSYDMLRQCALDVPIVSPSFYGNLYD